MRQFLETVESERELRSLTKNLIPALAENIFTYQENQIMSEGAIEFFRKREKALELGKDGFGGRIFFGSLALGIDKPSRIYPSTFLEPFYTKISDIHNLKIRVQYTGDSARGSYHHERQTINLNLSYEDSFEIIRIMKEYENQKRKITAISNLLSQSFLAEALLHELTHAYDYFVSKGKVDPGKKYIKPSSDWETYKKYFSQDIELNAFYSGLIKLLENQDTKYLMKFNEIISLLPFLSLTGSTFRISALPDEKKQRIYSRLYQWYTEPDEKHLENRGKQVFSNVVLFKYVSYEFIDTGPIQISRSSLMKGIEKTMRLTMTPNIQGKLSPGDILNYFEDSLRNLAKGKVPRKEVPVNRPSLGIYERANRYDFVYPLVEWAVGHYLTFYSEFHNFSDFSSISRHYKMYYNFVKYLSQEVGFSEKEFDEFNKNFRGDDLFPVEIFRSNLEFRDFL